MVLGRDMTGSFDVRSKKLEVRCQRTSSERGGIIHSRTTTGLPVRDDFGKKSCAIEKRPGPQMRIGSNRPISAKQYSKPACISVLLGPEPRKNPFLPCTIAIAPSMITICAAAEKRERKPK